MKIILLFSLIYFVISASDITEDQKGPAVNPKHSESETFCYSLSAWQTLDESWLDDDENEIIPSGVSDCVDNLLWDPHKGKYYDRCCYIRFQLKGSMHGGCIGLSEEQFLDITETIRRLENGDKNLWTSNAANSKVYQLDCNSSYLKFLSIASILLAFIF